MRNTFKKRVAECKSVALTVKSANGIQCIKDKYGKCSVGHKVKYGREGGGGKGTGVPNV